MSFNQKPLFQFVLPSVIIIFYACAIIAFAQTEKLTQPAQPMPNQPSTPSSTSSAPATPAANPADVSSIDAILAAVYDVYERREALVGCYNLLAS